MSSNTTSGGEMSFEEFNEFLSSPTIKFDTEENIEPQALFDKIRASVQSVLNRNFPNDPEKQQIVNRSNRINFACPSCGDSKWDKSKKRGNIYLGGYNFKCYNAESEWCAYTRSITSFLGKYGEIEKYTSLELAYLKKNTSEHHKISLGVSGSSFITHAADLFGIDEFAIPRQKIMDKLKLIDVNRNDRIFKYLNDRKQIPKNGDVRHFAYDLFNDHLYVFNMTPNKEKIIGMQCRVQRPRSKRDPRFLSKKYSEIWEDLFDITVKEEIKEQVDKFSLLYNVLQVNYGQDIPIFEGAIDANTMINLGYQSMALMGASQKIYLENGKYFYDNGLEDVAGRNAAMEMLKQSYDVFLWGKFLHDFPQYRFCKDINDIVVKGDISGEIFMKYFGNNQMDIIYL